MAGVSKNQRVAKKADRALASSGEQRTIVPLNSGKNAYVRVTGRTLHVATNSQAFIDALTEVGNAEKVATELKNLHAAYPDHGWSSAHARLVEAGAL